MPIARWLAPRRPAWAAIAIVLAAVAAPTLQSWSYVRLLARPDTRDLAGEWLQAHATPGTSIRLPNVTEYANPTLPPDEYRLVLSYKGLARALRQACEPDPRGGGVPSTKGTL